MALRDIIQAREGGGALGEKFAEDAEFDEGDSGIDIELEFGLGAKNDEARIVLFEEGEVGRGFKLHGDARSWSKPSDRFARSLESSTKS